MSDVRRQLAIVTNKVIFVLCLPFTMGISIHGVSARSVVTGRKMYMTVNDVVKNLNAGDERSEKTRHVPIHRCARRVS